MNAAAAMQPQVVDLPHLVAHFLSQEDLQCSFECVGWRVFLEGNKISRQRWAPVVRQLFQMPLRPAIVVVLADLQGLEWPEENRLRLEVVAAGGVLDQLTSKNFKMAVRERTVEAGPDVKADIPVQADISEAVPGPAASWDLYKNSYLSPEEFKRFQDAAEKETADGSIVS